MFNPGSFDDSIPRKGGVFDLVDEEAQDLESIAAAMDLSQDLSPGKFGVYYETKRPTKNELEREWLTDAQSKIGDLSEKDLLRKRFAAMR